MINKQLEVIDFDDLGQNNTNLLTSINNEIHYIDRLLLDLNKVLFITQPYGKDHIGITFFKRNGRAEPKCPFVIRTLGFKRFAKLKEKHLASQALSKGQFSINFRQTQTALGLVSQLLAYRHRLTDLKGKLN